MNCGVRHPFHCIDGLKRKIILTSLSEWSCSYVNMWLSIDMNSDVEMISSFPGDTRGNMTVRWVIMKVLRTPGESQEDPGMLPRDYTQLWSSRAQLSLTCFVMTGGSHQSRKDKKLMEISFSGTASLTNIANKRTPISHDCLVWLWRWDLMWDKIMEVRIF